MLNWIISFFLLAVATAIFGFSGLLGDLGAVVQYMAAGFVCLLIGCLIYTMITGRELDRRASLGEMRRIRSCRISVKETTV